MTKSNEQIKDDKIECLMDLASSLEGALLETAYNTALDQVQILRMIANTAESALWQAVVEARKYNNTWEEIGTALGISRQAAWEQFSELVKISG